MPVYAAGVSFWAMISMVPLLAMVVFGVAIFGEPDTVESFLQQLSATIPGETVEVLTVAVRGLIDASTETSTIGLLIAVVVAGWGASSGVSHLFRAINVAHHLDARPYLRRRIFALSRTVAALLFVIPIVALVAATPAALETMGAGGTLRWTISVIRWPVTAILVAMLLSTIYRVAPTSRLPARLVTRGVGVASILFLVASVAFSVYVTNFGRYDEAYGSFGTAVVTMLWVYLMVTAILLGAEVDATIAAVSHPPDHEDSSSASVNSRHFEKMAAGRDGRASGLEPGVSL